jgi:hypothetical protein
VTTYFRSRNLNNPTVYVQEEGQWRGYAPGGMVQRSAGLLPEVIRTRTVEISRDEAEASIALWGSAAQKTQQEQAAARTVYGPSSRPRSRWSRRLPYIAAGGAALIVVVILAVLATTGVFAGGTAGSPPESGGTKSVGKGVAGNKAQVVATVGVRPITADQLDQRVADFEAQYAGQTPDEKTAPDQYKQFQLAVLDYLVTYELARQKADELNIAVSDQDVQSQLDLILKASFGGDQAKFDDALKQQGLMLDQFKRIYKESALFKKVYTAVTKDVGVSDADIQAYYDQHKSDAYSGKSLDQVRDDIKSTLLGTKQKAAWRQWVDEAKAASGVTYADGWKPAGTAQTLVPGS